jgi:hypothetical protein
VTFWNLNILARRLRGLSSLRRISFKNMCRAVDRVLLPAIASLSKLTELELQHDNAESVRPEPMNINALRRLEKLQKFVIKRYEVGPRHFC